MAGTDRDADPVESHAFSWERFRGPVVAARRAEFVRPGRELTMATSAESSNPNGRANRVAIGTPAELHGQHCHGHDECRGEPGDQDRMP